MKPSRRNRRYVEAKPLTPEEQKVKDEEVARIWVQWQADMEKEKQERERIESVLQMLEIPFRDYNVSAKELVDILMDDEKAKAIFTKLKNKAFW